MKYLNAAALTNCWVHYEHLCRLTFSEFRSFVKELQMVQQQFIISELNNDSENSSERETSMNPSHFEKIQDEIEVSRNQPDYNPGEGSSHDELDMPYSRGFGANKVSFAIFGSFKHQFVIEDSPQYKRYISA